MSLFIKMFLSQTAASLIYISKLPLGTLFIIFYASEQREKQSQRYHERKGSRNAMQQTRLEVQTAFFVNFHEKVPSKVSLITAFFVFDPPQRDLKRDMLLSLRIYRFCFPSSLQCKQIEQCNANCRLHLMTKQEAVE